MEPEVKALIIVTVCITGLLIGCLCNNYYTTKIYVEYGYTQASLPGYSTMKWVK